MRCDMEKLISAITSEKLDKRTEVTFRLLGGLPDCKRINAKDYIKVINAENADVDTVLAFNRFDRPENKIECGNDNACLNTGSLALAAATNYAVYKLPYDATKFSSGIITLYVKGFTGSKNVTVKISDAVSFTNADVYTVAAVGKAGDFTPVVIDLSSVPSSTAGSGYTAKANGAYIAVNVNDANAVISSIAVFDSIEDFENNDVVKMRCLTSLEGDDAIDAAEATCANPNAGYDTTSPTFERTFTGSMLTSNYQKLNPLIGKGDAVKGFDIWSQEFAVTAENGYGVVTITDAYQDECGFVAVSADCELLKRYDIPALVALDEEHFIVMPQEDGTTKVYMNANLVGKNVTISYPREANITEQVADIENVGGVRVAVYVPYKMSNGQKRAKLYGNVLITSFSDPRGEDDTEFSITASIQKDASGHYYHIYNYE